LALVKKPPKKEVLHKWPHSPLVEVHPHQIVLPIWRLRTQADRDYAHARLQTIIALLDEDKPNE